jgi:hypothetical protein
MEFFTPQSDENPRLINQAGLFSRAPDRMTIEEWVKQSFLKEEKRSVAVKIMIPDDCRRAALRSLNRMNINHLTLFPDLYGAAAFCNMSVEIDGY